MTAQLKQIEDATCIRFPERTYQRDYVVIGNFGGCWSFIGRVGGAQRLAMSFGGGNTCLHAGMMMHEAMHAIGKEFR
jgi:Astacin (Peptidase family M12A)